MKYPKIPLAQSLIEICHAKGIRHIIISPGSRNAPLTLGFTQNPDFQCYSIADERCAAFFGLGIAQQTQKPVVLVCTSGSAVLNYYPAVAEAFYSQIPLVVISADRPSSKIDIGDGQTIRQENVLANHTLFNANLTEDNSESNDLKINQAFDKALVSMGPVHINVPFEEPLYETVSNLTVDPQITVANRTLPKVPFEDIFAASSVWNAASKKLVLVGTLFPNSLDESVIEHLAKDPSVLVMTETTSNLSHSAFIGNIDTFITPFTEDDFENYKPEVLLTFGGMIVSKRIKSYLRKYKPLHHWHVDSLRAYDTFGALSHHFQTTPNTFFNQFLPYALFTNSNYQKQGQLLKEWRKIKHDLYLKDLPFSDLKAFQILLNSLPDCQLQISNSSSIRYAQLFDIPKTVAVFCNRGTSGIDGSTSTAIGAALVNNKPTVLITGDISFFYDSNALWNRYIPNHFKIIILNNGGGGIFRILPGHEETEVFTTFFETSHCLTASNLAQMYGFGYLQASHAVELEEKLKLLYSDNSKPQILEIFTPTQQNEVYLKNYFKKLV